MAPNFYNRNQLQTSSMTANRFFDVPMQFKQTFVKLKDIDAYRLGAIGINHTLRLSLYLLNQSIGHRTGKKAA